MSGKRKPVVECKDTSSGSSSSGSEEDSLVPVPTEDYRKFRERKKSPDGSANRSKGLITPTVCSGSNKGKKKKALGDSFTDNNKANPLLCSAEPPNDAFFNSKHTQGKCRIKKEPLPMKLRALPQSFWQQPNATIDISPGQMYAKLPPLLNKDVSADEMTRSYPSSSETKSDRKAQTQVLRVNDTDWIFQLFDVLDQKAHIGKRRRPKKVLPVQTSLSLKTEDPVLGTAATTLIPVASEPYNQSNTATFTMISLKDKDKSISLPALNIEKNYSQILSEVVVKL